MGGLNKRAGALQDYIESSVQERLEAEVEAILDRLRERLPPDEYRRVLEILASGAEEERWGA